MGAEQLIPGVAQVQEVAKAARSPFVKTVGGVLIGSVLGTGTVGVAEGIRAYRSVEEYIPQVSQNITKDLGDAKIISTDRSVDKKTFVGYTVNVPKSRVGTETRFQIKVLGLNVPSGLSSGETFSGNVKANICQDAFNEKITYDPNTNKAEVVIPKDAISICAETDIPTRTFTPDNGILNVPGQNLDTLLRGLKSIGINFMDLPVVKDAMANNANQKSTEQNYAEIQAWEQAAKQCGPLVWPTLEKAYENSVKKEALEYFSLMTKFTNKSMTVDDITVKIGDTEADPSNQINFTTQYKLKVQELKKGASNNKFDLSAEKSGVGSCTLINDAGTLLESSASANGASK